MSQSLQAMLHARLRRRPNGRAIAFINAQGEFDWWSYRKFFSRGVASALALRKAGVKRGDACIIVLPSGEPSTVALMGVLLLGGIPLMAAPPSLQKFNSDLLKILINTAKRTEAKVVVHDDSLTDIPKRSKSNFVNISEIYSGEEIDPAKLKPVIPKISDIAGYQLTSGTTGFPRVCVWRHKGVQAALNGMAKAMDLKKSDVCFNWTPLYHDMGLVNNFLLCMSREVPMILQSPNDFVKNPARWLRGLHATGSTITWSPNFGYAMAAERVTAQDMKGVRLDKVRQFWNAAERIHLESVRAFEKKFRRWGVRPESLKMNFGCTENVGGATFTKLKDPYKVDFVDREIFQAERIAVPRKEDKKRGTTLAFVSCGPPHPDMNIKILGPDDKPLPDGHVGEVALDSPSHLEYFLKDKTATKKSFRGDLVLTGDLGYMRDGELYWVGRSRERITVRGKKFDPSDFERALLDIEGLRKGCFAAFGAQNKAQGTESLIVIAEVRDESQKQRKKLSDAIRAGIFRALDVTVNEVVLVKTGTLSKTSSGKRRHLRFGELYASGELDQYIVR